MDKYFMILFEVIMWIFADICLSGPFVLGTLFNRYLFIMGILLFVVIQVAFISMLIWIIKAK